MVSWTLVGCNSNKNNETTPTTTDETAQWDFIIEDTTDEYNAVVRYNDNLVELASQCILSEDSIWDAYNDYEEGKSTMEDVQQAISNTIEECQNSTNQINELWDWEWDSSLKDSVIDIIEKKMDYYAKFWELVLYLPYLWNDEKLPDEEAATYTQILSDLDILDSELEEANNNLIAVQETFSSNHGFDLEESNE